MLQVQIAKAGVQKSELTVRTQGFAIYFRSPIVVVLILEPGPGSSHIT